MHLKATVHNNMIGNNPITLGAIKSTHDIFGTGVPSLKGKTMRRQSSSMRMHYVTIPRQIYGWNLRIILLADLFFVNGLEFLLKI